jgi:hypothetical protein
MSFGRDDLLQQITPQEIWFDLHEQIALGKTP